MKAIDALIKAEIAKRKQNLLFELLGKYGDKLPKDIQDDMRVYADDLDKEVDRLNKRAVKEI